jgi:septal ring factor EnvC (AmiA/AmiB activator)
MNNKWETAPNSLKVLYFNTHEAFDTFSIDPELLDRVLDDYNELEAKHQKALEAISRCEDEIDDKDKLIGEQHKKIDRLWLVNNDLNKKIKELEKENKDLKDMLEKHEELGKNIGKRVADSIREGCDKGVYKLNPYTRIDIHVNEIEDMPMIFGPSAIPRIAIMFNNTQTEMERDTAQHECEELDKKFKELVKVNNELRMTLAMCERDANMARELCHTIAFNAERARNETPWFTNTYEEEK